MGKWCQVLAVKFIGGKSPYSNVDNSKTYNYRNEIDETRTIGDILVVDTIYGPQVARVVEIQGQVNWSSGGLKQVLSYCDSDWAKDSAREYRELVLTTEKRKAKRREKIIELNCMLTELTTERDKYSKFSDEIQRKIDEVQNKIGLVYSEFGGIY